MKTDQTTMKGYFAGVLAVFCCGASLFGGPASAYYQTQNLTSPTNIDATAFINEATMEFTLSSVADEEGDYFSGGGIKFSTRDTVYYTNTASGQMISQTGFNFYTVNTSKGTVYPASQFVNDGTITAVDLFEAPAFYEYNGGTTVFLPGSGVPNPSYLLVDASNIFNKGTISVGADGAMKMVGKTLTNSSGALIAGDLSNSDEFDVTSVEETYDETVNGTLAFRFFEESPILNDLYWGATNGNLALNTYGAGIGLGDTPPQPVVGRSAGSGDITLPLNGIIINGGTSNIVIGNAAEYATYIYTYPQRGEPTNFYYNIVLVNTNFEDTNLSYQVKFSQVLDVQPPGPIPDPNAVEPIIQFSVPVFDVITGQETTNAVYLVDSGAALSNTTVAIYTNTAWLSKYGRPDYFALTLREPVGWLTGQPSNDVADVADLPALIYPGTTNTYESMSVPYAEASYGVQIGWNPEQVDGTFALSTELLGLFNDIPGPTNQPAQIDIEAGQMDLNNSRIRAEGFVNILASNLVNHPTTGVDWGQANAALGATNGNLVISNVFPTSFSRVRGDVFAWAANWENVGTNAVATNVYIFHVLIVDQTLRGNFKPTVRNLALSAKNSVTIYDPLTVINQSLFNSSNLDIASTVEMSQNAASVQSANMPLLKNLMVAPGGSLIADNELDLGLDLSQGQTSPVKRKYTINSITNYGVIEAVTPLLQSQYFENDGDLFAEASAHIDASIMNFGVSLTNQPSELLTGGDLTLSALAIDFTNSSVTTGLLESGALNMYATSGLSDGVSSAPSVTSNLVNIWQVDNGFNLFIKPTMGDLYGTEIRTSVSNYNVADHVWAGIDYGLNADGSVNLNGFANNQVIGHLIMDRLASTATLEFTGAGTKNAMYVDYLELDDFSFSDYRNGLVIDPNIKIYFANANADPFKLMAVYPNQLIWASNFWGPNSTAAVTNVNGNVCLINAGWEPYLFNNYNPTTYPPFPADCPVLGESDALRMLVLSPFSGATKAEQQAWLATCAPTTLGSNALQTVLLSYTGSGSVVPSVAPKQVTQGSIETVTATPAKGWVFKDWTISGLPADTAMQSPVLKFAVVSNAVITANFIANPFTSLAGVYNGLFYDTDTNASAGSGAGYFTLTLQPSGVFSGRLLMGPTTYTFNSQFFGTGAQQVKAISGKQSVTVTLQLDMTGASGQITGDVNGGSWDSGLMANVTPVWTAQHSSPLAGKYTMAFIPGSAGIGDSYGVVTVSKLGVVSVAGTLADDIAFSQSAAISKNGEWPFYAYAAAGKDTVLGWVSFDGGTLSGTNIIWNKAAGNGKYYKGGFSSVNQLTGSLFQPPLALQLEEATVGGIDLPWTSQKNFSYVFGDLTLSINATTGVFTGKYGAGKEAVSGVVLQNQDGARGFFLGTTESGEVLLQGN